MALYKINTVEKSLLDERLRLSQAKKPQSENITGAGSYLRNLANFPTIKIMSTTAYSLRRIADYVDQLEKEKECPNH